LAGLKVLNVIPRFRFPFDVRNEATLLLGSRTSRFGESVAWGARVRLRLADELENLASATLGRSLRKTRVEDAILDAEGDFIEEMISLLEQLRDMPPVWDERN